MPEPVPAYSSRADTAHACRIMQPLVQMITYMANGTFRQRCEYKKAKYIKTCSLYKLNDD